MTFDNSHAHWHAHKGEVDACGVSCSVSNQKLEQGSGLELSGAQNARAIENELSCVIDSQGSSPDLMPDGAPAKPNGYQALKPLSLWCTLMIVLYFLQGCFEGGSTLSTVFTALSTLSLVLLPVVIIAVAWKYFRALNAYHKALEMSE